ncbi:MAG: hypothetical protein WCA59_06505, partial [Candidatus Binataceae bacterium]
DYALAQTKALGHQVTFAIAAFSAGTVAVRAGFQNAIHRSFCSKVRMNAARKHPGLLAILKDSSTVWNLRLGSCHELLAQTHDLAERPYDAAQTRLRDRTAASQRSVWAASAPLLLRPMQIQLSGLREQGRRPQRR